jgi:hypothetical protein
MQDCGRRDHLRHLNQSSETTFERIPPFSVSKRDHLGRGGRRFDPEIKTNGVLRCAVGSW